MVNVQSATSRPQVEVVERLWRWVWPLAGFIKISFDGAFRKNDSIEAMVAQDAMRLAYEFGFSTVVVEGDSQMVVNMVNGKIQIRPIEVEVMQFYDKMYEIQVLEARRSSDGDRLSLGNRTMLEEEIMVGFDEEALT
ncbi:hypothetical protein LOK49_LG11G00273 [Camellia lanceoleosa]|uniref:Uncharacterized protein n=1 Tax=Camellia lanceoleosa TaxID=1840588 RepID=A0ACC0G5S0_9ERIC|nr:hypothetical protein LOK49_LG11G00273 [Camellia lanceoleosa]